MQKNNRIRHIRSYLIIVALFILMSTISTIYIRFIQMRHHIKAEQTEAYEVSSYAKSRITSYEAYEWLIDHWMETKNVSAPSDELKYGWINELDLPLVTEEQVMAMTEEEQEAFSYICYTRLTYGYDLMDDAFSTSQLSFVSFEGDDAYVLFENGDSSINNYHISNRPTEFDTSYKKELEKILASRNEEGIFEKYYFPKEKRTYLMYYTPVICKDEVKTIIIWERDYSQVEKEITRDSLGISIANITLLFIIDIIIIMIYRRYRRERQAIAAQIEHDKAEMDVCTKIQLSQLPDIEREVSGRSAFDISSFIQPAKGIGGDFYDCFMIDDDHLGLVIADVSDKGIPAAMFMMAARSLIRSEMKQNKKPEIVMKNINEQLSDRNEAGMFVTVWLAVIDLITGRCSVVNAGHENPAVKHPDGDWEIVRYHHMMPAAITPATKYTEHYCDLVPGDMIFVYTDGVTDAENIDNKRFGEDGILQTLMRSDSTDPYSIVRSMCSEIKSFSYGKEQFDDICMICFRYKGTDTITVDASDDKLAVVNALVKTAAVRAGIDEKRISYLRLASEEIFGNIIDYAYPEEKGKVIVKAEEDKEKGMLNITFTDFGSPFDPTKKVSPDMPDDIEDIKIGGLGIYFTKELTDSISYKYDNANILTIGIRTGDNAVTLL